MTKLYPDIHITGELGFKMVSIQIPGIERPDSYYGSVMMVSKLKRELYSIFKGCTWCISINTISMRADDGSYYPAVYVGCLEEEDLVTLMLKYRGCRREHVWDSRAKFFMMDNR